MPYSRSNGVEIWYEVAGDGPALIFIHANPFDNMLFFYQMAHFSTWFRTVSVDIRGYGRSTKEPTPYTLADMEADVLGVMRDIDIDKAVLCGCSVGSRIAQLLALDHPDLFSALVLVGGNSGPSGQYQEAVAGYRADHAAYQRLHMSRLVAPGFPDTQRGAYLCGIFTERSPRLDGESIAQVFLASNATDNTPRLPEIRVPTLVINGEHDNSLPTGKRTASLIPGAIHEILPDSGHACCLEDPAGFDALVIAFLAARGLMPTLA